MTLAGTSCGSTAPTSGTATRPAARAAAAPRVSGHSLRVGAAQSLAAAGAGLVQMQQAGRWQSPAMPAHYAARGAVATLRGGSEQ